VNDHPIREHDRVVLAVDLPAERLEAGDVGDVSHIDGPPSGPATGYELEFVALTGTTAAVVTVAANDIRPVSVTEIPHARSRSAA